MIWFRTTFMSDGITEVEVINVLPTSIRTIEGIGRTVCLRSKRGGIVNYHETEEEARAFLVGREEKMVNQLRAQLEKAEQKLMAMKKAKVWRLGGR